MTPIIELYKLCDDSRLLGAIQELEQRRDSDIRLAVKFLGNSQFKQLCHITSEVWECWKSWFAYKFLGGSKNDLTYELVDVQGSCQTMQEGAMNLSKTEIYEARRYVKNKNDLRGYNEVEK